MNGDTYCYIVHSCYSKFQFAKVNGVAITMLHLHLKSLIVPQETVQTGNDTRVQEGFAPVRPEIGHNKQASYRAKCGEKKDTVLLRLLVQSPKKLRSGNLS